MQDDLQAEELVWRYVSIAKYVDLLRSQALYLPKASLLSDLSEGKWIAHGFVRADRNRWNRIVEGSRLLDEIIGKSANDDDALRLSQQYADHYRDRVPNLIIEVLAKVAGVYPHKRLEYLKSMLKGWRKNAARSLKSEAEWREQTRIQREAVYVSCWNRHSSMSFAMWQLYGGGTESVALKSKISRLARLIDSNRVLLSDAQLSGCVWPVRYADVHQEEQMFADEMADRLTDTVDTTVAQFTIKPQIYADEREVRLIVYPQRTHTDPVVDPHPDWSGFSMPLKPAVDSSPSVDSIVEAVHLHPNVDRNSMIFKVVEDLHRRYELEIPISATPTQALGELSRPRE